jgi:hypothetical protein
LVKVKLWEQYRENGRKKEGCVGNGKRKGEKD